MAAQDPFTLVPQEVVTKEPVYNNEESQTESMKKEYFNLSSTPTEQWVLSFKALSNTDRDTLLTHFNDQLGGYYSFSWQSVPFYVNSGSNITGRWVKGSLSMAVIGNRWNCSVTFEKEN